MKRYSPFLKALSAVLSNLSAGWFGLAFITPNFVDITKIGSIIALTKDILFGILFLLATTIVERSIKK